MKKNKIRAIVCVMMSAMVMLGSSPAYAAQDTVNASVSDDANNEISHTGRIGQRVVENRISADDVDSVYVEKVLPEKMKWNLESIKRFRFRREILTMFRTVFAVLGKDYN